MFIRSFSDVQSFILVVYLPFLRLQAVYFIFLNAGLQAVYLRFF